MKFGEFYAFAESFAPIKYSEEFCARYGAYDNSGMLVDFKNEVTGVVFCLDLSEAAVSYAVERGASVIVTHHPAIYAKIAKIEEGGIGSAVLRAAKNGVSVASFHLNLDAAPGGIDESLGDGIKKAAAAASGKEYAPRSNEKIMYSFSTSEGGYGRVYDVEKTSARSLKEAFDKEFGGRGHTLLFGAEDKTIGRVASFCGAGADEQSIAYALENGADMIVSSDFKHHLLREAVLSGAVVLCPTHYLSESYGFHRFYKKIAEATEIPCFYYGEDELL